MQPTCESLKRRTMSTQLRTCTKYVIQIVLKAVPSILIIANEKLRQSHHSVSVQTVIDLQS